jgi:hypothetical protein
MILLLIKIKLTVIYRNNHISDEGAEKLGNGF